METDFHEWRGYDLAPRIAKIRRAFRMEAVNSAEEPPILVNTPAYFAFGSNNKPPDYYTNPASMLAYQTDGYENHLKRVDDDYVPYFMPWFGTGVLASGFGARVKMPDDPADDPAVLEPLLKTPLDVARLRLPDPAKDGWMPRVLAAIDYAIAQHDLPVGLTDLQGPLATAGQLCGQAQLYRWMYTERPLVHDLMALITEAFVHWVKVQKGHIGEPLEWSYGLQGAYSPDCGVWESDDDLVLVNADLYAEFVAPYVSRIFKTFGGGSLHFCGNGLHHLENFQRLDHLKVINTSALGHFAEFNQLCDGLRGQAVIQLQDASPAEPETYYAQIFSRMVDFRGLMLVTFVMDNVGMDNQGGYIPVAWDPYETANRIVRSVRQAVTRRLAGETIWANPTALAAPRAAQPLALKPAGPETHTPEQIAALAAVRTALVELDDATITTTVQAALALGLPPLDIIVDGMAAGMTEVGQRFEAGEYYLPELVMAGETMKEGMTVLTPLLQAGAASAKPKGKVVLGTVKGDLHDIGKNLVKTMLEGSQFEVIDLGVDVGPQGFVNAIREHKAQLLAMSALLTTTTSNMKLTMEALESAGLRPQVKVMIGGAPLSREFADQIGADGYAATAVSAVYEAERLLTLL